MEHTAWHLNVPHMFCWVNEWVGEWWCEQWQLDTEESVRWQQLLHWSSALAGQQCRESTGQLQSAMGSVQEGKVVMWVWRRWQSKGWDGAHWLSSTTQKAHKQVWATLDNSRGCGAWRLGERTREVSLGKMHWEQSYEGRLGPYRMDLRKEVILCRENDVSEQYFSNWK